MNSEIIIKTIIISLAIFIVSYLYQLSVLLNKVCTPNIPMTKDNVIKDLVPWIPYFPIALMLNIVILIVNRVSNIMDKIRFAINKFKILK